MAASELESVPAISELDLKMLFRLRTYSHDAALRWGLSPVLGAGFCVEQAGTVHYGTLNVPRIVLYTCSGNDQQAWNFLAAP